MRLFVFLTALLFALQATAQSADRLYVMDCGHDAAKDQSRWSPGINVGKPVDSPTPAR